MNGAWHSLHTRTHTHAQAHTKALTQVHLKQLRLT